MSTVRVETTVPEAVAFFKEIQTQPEKVFEMIGPGVRKMAGNYLRGMTHFLMIEADMAKQLSVMLSELKKVRAILILVFILILGSCCNGFAVPLVSVPGPDVHGNNPLSIASGAGSSAPPAQIPSESVSASSVPANDPIVKGTQPNSSVPKIPKFPVEMYVRQGKSTRFELFFLNVRYGYDLHDFEFYNAWCLRKNAPLPGGTIHVVRLYNISDPNLPPEFKRMEWHQIDYLINHAKGSKEDIQQAIWRLAKSPQPRRLSAAATRLLREANLKGKDYIPAAGDLIAIICQSVTNQQPLIIEYKIPKRKPPKVKAAFFPPPLQTVGGFASRLFIPPAFFIPGGGGSAGAIRKTPVPEPSSLLLLAAAMIGMLTSRKVGKRFQGRS